VRVGVDLLPFDNRLAGVGRYAQSLIQCLQEIDHENSYVLYVRRPAVEHFSVSGSNFSLAVCSLPQENRVLRILYEQTVLPIRLMRDGIDLLFVPSVVKPLCTPCKTVSTIHDLTPFMVPEKYGRLRTFYVKLMTVLSARMSARVITVSRASKRDIVSLLRIRSTDVSVVYLGVSGRFLRRRSDTVTEGVAGESSPDGKYVLFVGTLEPGKNVPRLIHAFELLRDNHPCKLLLVGRKGWLCDDVEATVAGSRWKSDIVMTGYVEEDQLVALYRNAELFIYPSLYEGFGLPVLEAMACGTPVVASNTSSLPEVVEGAGVLVDPYSIDEMAEAMVNVITKEGLRTSLVEHGLKRASNFSWLKTAQRTLEVFELVHRRG
jgi:glycosyltransferase involved in cell wall biosynthesis